MQTELLADVNARISLIIVYFKDYLTLAMLNGAIIIHKMADLACLPFIHVHVLAVDAFIHEQHIYIQTIPVPEARINNHADLQSHQ